MKRDSKGRFVTKDEEGNKIVLYIPSLRGIVLWLIILWVILPWITIISKFNIINNLLYIFDGKNQNQMKKLMIQLKKMEFSFKYVYSI